MHYVPPGSVLPQRGPRDESNAETTAAPVLGPRPSTLAIVQPALNGAGYCPCRGDLYMLVN